MTITLATLPEATAQQVFDQVATHLLTQRRKSEDADQCRYRGPDNTMCAAGCLVSAAEYSDSMEGHSWAGLGFSKAHRSLILCLQELHDDFDVEHWYLGLKAIGSLFSLNSETLLEHPLDTQDSYVFDATYCSAKITKGLHR